MHNLFGVEKPLLGGLASAISIVLTGLLLVAAVVAIGGARRRQERPAPGGSGPDSVPDQT